MAVSSRRLHPEEKTALPQTRIHTRNTREPRVERVRIPQRVRPSPISVAPGEPSPLLKTPPISQRGCIGLYESPREPEIVDLAAPSTWPRRATPQNRTFMKQAPPSPSVGSQCSARQSEMSFGILDYYIRDPSPIPSPKVPLLAPRIGTPVIDRAIGNFDFGLPSKSPPLQVANGECIPKTVPEVKAGAERAEQDGCDEHQNIGNTDCDRSRCDHQWCKSLPLPPSLRAQNAQKHTYRLFPVIKNTTPPRASAEVADLSSPRECTPTNNTAYIHPHSQPDPSYRPRKESLSSSIRSRKDSFNSFCGTRRIQMRILSGSSTNTSKTRSTASIPISASSPPDQSRWSDDTITSPVAATMPGLRTSFGSLMGRDSSQYPACFFEDDDDEFVPLRRKLLWKRSASLNQEQRVKGRRPSDDRYSFRRCLRNTLLCGGCCGASN